MKRHLFRNLKIISILLCTAAFFQNCSYSNLNHTQKKSDFEYNKVTGLKCPVFLRPDCTGDSKLRLVENDLGCRYHICEIKNRLSSCPKQSTPLCKAHQKVQTFKDQNSCSFSKCVLKTAVQKPDKLLDNVKLASKKCPSLEALKTCQEGQVRSLRIDKNKCLSLTCRKKMVFSCPILKNKKCSKNEVTYSVFDQKGCANVVCRNSAEVKCPKRLNLNCKIDELVRVEADKDGCKKSVCYKKPIIAKQDCSLSKPPRCRAGRTLQVSVLPSGCTKAFCR